MGKRKIMLVKFLHLHFKLGMFLSKFVVDEEPVRTPDHPVKQHHVQHAESGDKKDFPEHLAPQSLHMLAVIAATCAFWRQAGHGQKANVIHQGTLR